mgnify:FL=1
MASKSFLINSSNKTLSFPLNLPTHDYSREIGVAIARQEPKLALCCQIALLASSSSHATMVINQQKLSFETSKKVKTKNPSSQAISPSISVSGIQIIFYYLANLEGIWWLDNILLTIFASIHKCSPSIIVFVNPINVDFYCKCCKMRLFVWFSNHCGPHFLCTFQHERQRRVRFWTTFEIQSLRSKQKKTATECISVQYVERSSWISILQWTSCISSVKIEKILECQGCQCCFKHSHK